MKTDKAADHRTRADASFARLIGYTFVAAIVSVVCSLFYLGWNDVLTARSGILTGIAVFLSVMLGAGLMAVGFYSSNVGHDETATGRHRPQADGERDDERSGN